LRKQYREVANNKLSVENLILSLIIIESIVIIDNITLLSTYQQYSPPPLEKKLKTRKTLERKTGGLT